MNMYLYIIFIYVYIICYVYVYIFVICYIHIYIYMMYVYMVYIYIYLFTIFYDIYFFLQWIQHFRTFRPSNSSGRRLDSASRRVSLKWIELGLA